MTNHATAVQEPLDGLPLTRPDLCQVGICEKMNRKSLLRFFNDVRRVAATVSVVVAIVSGALSFLTYREFLADADFPVWLVNGAALGIAIACGAIMHLVFVMIVGGIPIVDKLPRRGFIPLIAVLMALISMFSTYSNVLTTSGNSALALHNARQMDGLASVGITLQGVALEASQFVPGLNTVAVGLHADAECERIRGCRTGSPGTGDLTNALSAGGDKVTTVARALEAAQEAISSSIPAINAAFSRGDDIEVRSLLSALRSKIPVALLRSAAADLRADLGITGTSTRAALRERQNEEIASLQGNMTNTAAALERMAATLEERIASIALPERRSLTKAGAVWAYADQLIPQIAVGIAIDWVLVFAAFMLGQFRDATPRPEEDVSDISLADARRVHRELAALVRDVNGRDVPEPTEPTQGPEKPEPEVTSDHGTPWEEEDGDQRDENTENVIGFPDLWKIKTEHDSYPTE